MSRWSLHRSHWRRCKAVGSGGAG